MDLLIPLALAALLIFFLFNSRRKQKARMEQIKTGLVPGATVMTTFGVFGTVVSIDEENNQVTIESGPGTTLRVHRQAIGQIDNPEAAAPLADDSTVDAAGDSNEAPAITDAELDAMNERKRAEAEASDDSVSADSVSDETVDTADEVKSDEVETVDSADSDTATADTAADSTETVDEAGETTESGTTDSENGKKN